MTTYFDTKHEQLHRVKESLQAHEEHSPAWRAAYARMETIDGEVVWDASICSEMPGFPADLADQVNALVLQRSLTCQPVNQRGGPVPESALEAAQEVNRLIHDMHTIFHQVSQRNIDGFSDSPMSPLRVLYAKAEEKREQLCAAAVK